MIVTDEDMKQLSDFDNDTYKKYVCLPMVDMGPIMEEGFYTRIFTIGNVNGDDSSGRSLFLRSTGSTYRFEHTVLKSVGRSSSSKVTNFDLKGLVKSDYTPDYRTHLKTVMIIFDEFGYSTYDKLLDCVSAVFYNPGESQTEVSTFWEQTLLDVVSTLYLYKIAPKIIYLYVATLCSIWIDFKTQNKLN